ncbi:MAG TPA: protein phosphatase 2C domain-containing protein [Kofleriaceae bacterium]|nr:protein phosphatase 2C domain-containing protein [Kofleriaceae bacterium]
MSDTLPILHPDADAPRFSAADGLAPREIAGATDVGKERERNEDHFMVAELDRWLYVLQSSLIEQTDSVRAGGTEAVLLAVADGIGGHAGGDMASAVVLDALLHYTGLIMPWFGQQDRDAEARIGAELAAAVRSCQERLFDVARRMKLSGGQPGTTLTAAYLTGRSLLVLHVGDSRCYRLRDGQLERLTRDHTLAQEIADSQGLAPETAEQSPYAHILSNAVGGSDDDVRPEVAAFDLAPGDTILLCTDGLHGQVSDAEIAAVLGRAPEASAACAELIRRANADRGRDNVTAIVARY